MELSCIASKQASNLYLLMQVRGPGSFTADVDLLLLPQTDILERIPWVLIYRPRKDGQLS